MYGLIDCNNFFVSCERVFNPMLMQRPVIVLSNNDGCAVALSNEAKALGIRRGDPYFKIKEICENNGVFVLSGNHRFYGDMSKRVFSVLGERMQDVEVYSIDEAFFKAPMGNTEPLTEIGRDTVTYIRRCTGIPTSIGFAPTKTLAKLATRFAKKYPAYRCVCLIDNEEKRRKALSLTKIGDIWGIGRRLVRQMQQARVTTALDFADMPLEKVQAKFNITMERTWRELNGQACIDLVPETPTKRQICCSRSFGEMIDNQDTLESAVASFITSAAARLRREQSLARTVTVFLRTNRFREDMEQYSNAASINLDEHTSDTTIFAHAACEALHKVFRPGLMYKKAGVLLTDILANGKAQPSLFTDPNERAKRKRLMEAVDAINRGSNAGSTVHIASWRPTSEFINSEMKSRQYNNINGIEVFTKAW